MADMAEVYRRQVAASLVIAEAMRASADLQTVLRAMLAALVDNLDYRAASLQLLDPEQEALRLEAQHGLSAENARRSGTELAHSVIDRQVLAGQVAASSDLRVDANLAMPEAAQREGVRALLGVPLRLGNRTIGALRVYSAEVHEFAPEERAFVGGIANLAARAVADASLYAAFQSIARQVNSTLEVKEVLHNLLQSLVHELNFKAAAVRLIGPHGRRLHLAAAEGLSAAYLDKGEIRIADSPMDRRVLDENKPVVVFDVAHEPGFQYPQQAASEGIRSAMAVPLRLHDSVIGVLRVYSAQPHRFSQEEIALVEAVADLGAIALENARLHEALKERYEAAREDWSGWYRYLALS